MYDEDIVHHYGDSLTITDWGPPEFSRGANTLTFTPPATISGPSQQFVYHYTVTDAPGASISGEVVYTVYNPSVCSVQLTPEITTVACVGAGNPPPTVMLHVAEPPGTGGVVSYFWYLNHQTPPEVAATTGNLVARRTGVYACMVRRTGGSGGCADQWMLSNDARVTFLTADIGEQGGTAGPDGTLNQDDFVVFIDDFFNANPAADVGGQGGLLGPDGAYDNNDFIAFIDLFFDGC